MKLKSNLKEYQAQITFEASEVSILKDTLKKLNNNLTFLEMITLLNLIDKFETFEKNIKHKEELQNEHD